jgi:predicted DNA-binding protein (MmcQ/YjbR family)
MTPTQVAELCLQLPGAHESIKWGNNRVFSIADNKMFALLSFPAKGRESLAFKVDNDLFLAFTDRPGIRPAPYLARARWVSMEAPFPLPDIELRARPDPISPTGGDATGQVPLGRVPRSEG